MIEQTRTDRNVHHKESEYVKNTIKIWQTEWGKQNELIENIKNKNTTEPNTQKEKT